MLRAALTLVALTGCVTVGQPKYFCFPGAAQVMHAGAPVARIPDVVAPPLVNAEVGGQAEVTAGMVASAEVAAADIAVGLEAGLTLAPVNVELSAAAGGRWEPSWYQAAPGDCVSGSAPAATVVTSGPREAASCSAAGGVRPGDALEGRCAGSAPGADGRADVVAIRATAEPALSCSGHSAGLAVGVSGAPPLASGVSDAASPAEWGHSPALGVCTEFLGVPLQGSTDIVFLLDRSSSMSEAATFADLSWQEGGAGRVDGVAIGVPSAQAGPLLPDKLTVARRELLKVLDNLPDGTRFAVGFFDERLTWFSPGLAVLTPESRLQVRRFVESVQPGGATAAVPALQGALALNPKRVVLLSDGAPNFEGSADQLAASAREQIRRGVRFDAVVLGAGQDGSLLASLARESGGLARSY